MRLTIATLLTLFRILLIPVFVLFAVYFGQSVADGTPQPLYRWLAIGAFVLAAVTDALDGWVARRFRQQSKLGAILDPLADKGLLLTAIITLSVIDWGSSLPLWFPVLVIARDVVILVGCGVIHHLNGKLDVKPSGLGKAATASQMVALAWVMLQVPYLEVPVFLSGILSLLSGLGYVRTGLKLLHRHH